MASHARQNSRFLTLGPETFVPEDFLVADWDRTVDMDWSADMMMLDGWGGFQLGLAPSAAGDRTWKPRLL